MSDYRHCQEKAEMGDWLVWCKYEYGHSSNRHEFIKDLPATWNGYVTVQLPWTATTEWFAGGKVRS